MGERVAFLEEMIPWLRDNADAAMWFQLTYDGRESWAFGPQYNTSLTDFNTGENTPLGSSYSREAQKISADINRDGCVDILDLVVVGAAFGRCN